MKTVHALAFTCTLLVAAIQPIFAAKPSDAPAAPAASTAPANDDVLQLKDLDEMPKPKGPRAAAAFPFELRSAGRRTGAVLLEFVVSKKGNVTHVEVKESDHPLFADSAVAAVSQWRFHPGKKAGKPVNCRMRLPVQFNVDGR